MTEIVHLDCFEVTPPFHAEGECRITPTVSYESDERPWSEWMQNVSMLFAHINDDSLAYSCELRGRAPQSVLVRIGMVSRLYCTVNGIDPRKCRENDRAPRSLPNINVRETGHGLTLLFVTMNPAHGIVDADIESIERATGKRVGTVIVGCTSDAVLTCENYGSISAQVEKMVEAANDIGRPIAVLTSAPLSVAYAIGRYLSNLPHESVLLDRARMGSDIVVTFSSILLPK